MFLFHQLVTVQGGDVERTVVERSSEAQASGGAPRQPEGTAGERLRFDEWREVVSTT